MIHNLVSYYEISYMFTPDYLRKIITSPLCDTLLVSDHLRLMQKVGLGGRRSFSSRVVKSNELYLFIKRIKAIEIIKIVEHFVNEHLQNHKLDIQNSIQLYIRWRCYRKIIFYFNKLICNRIMFKDADCDTFLDYYTISLSIILQAKYDWTEIYIAKQRIILSKLPSIPIDIHITISQYLNTTCITDRLLLKSINLQLYL
jgi:hypothetical protein